MTLFRLKFLFDLGYLVSAYLLGAQLQALRVVRASTLSRVKSGLDVRAPFAGLVRSVQDEWGSGRESLQAAGSDGGAAKSENCRPWPFKGGFKRRAKRFRERGNF